MLRSCRHYIRRAMWDGLHQSPLSVAAAVAVIVVGLVLLEVTWSLAFCQHAIC